MNLESRPGRIWRRRGGFASGLVAVVATAALLAACGGGGSKAATASPAGTASRSTPSAAGNDSLLGYQACPPSGAANALTGAGGTFIYPLMSKWVGDYQKQCSVQVNYQSVGSGAGINQITQKTVDFGESDAIMTPEQESGATAAGGPIMHIPMTSGAEAITFNLPGIQRSQLKLDGQTLANIYLGNIKKWNDPAITALNPGLSLPNADIAVVHRSDGSGTTFIFTNYLSKVSPDWQSKVGSATSVNWPVGIGGQGNEGVAGQVKQLPGAIGYVELAYAEQNNLPWAQLKNAAGSYLDPSLQGATNATQGVTLPDDMKIMITNSTNAQAYPIAGFTWVLAYVNQPDASKGRTLASFLWWAIHDGQQDGAALDYASLSADATKKAEAEILQLQCSGSPCLSK